MSQTEQAAEIDASLPKNTNNALKRIVHFAHNPFFTFSAISQQLNSRQFFSNGRVNFRFGFKQAKFDMAPRR